METKYIEYQENQSRRNNIRVFGVPESAGKTWESVETKVDIERAHRVERRKSGGINQHQAGAKPRVIVCRLSSWKQKEAVRKKLSNGKNRIFFSKLTFTTVFVDTRLWETKHLRKRFQNFRQSYMLSTCRIEIHQSQPLVWPTDLIYVMLAGCDWWISIRHVDNM